MREQLDAIIGTWRTEGEVDDGTTDTGTGLWHRDGVAEPWMTLRFSRA